MASQKNPPFTIKNHILAGKGVSTDRVNVNIGKLILSTLKSQPEFTSQVEPDVPFKTLQKWSVTTALWMINEGIKAGDIVAIYSGSTIYSHIPFLACLYLGIIVNPWNDYANEFDILQFLEMAKPKMIFTDIEKYYEIKNFLGRFEFSPKFVIFQYHENAPDDYALFHSVLYEFTPKIKYENFKCAKTKSSDTAIIVFTAGTTDIPKCVELPYSVFAAENQQVPIMTLNSTGMWLGCFTSYINLILTVRAILSYVKVFRYSGIVKENICQKIEKHKVNWIVLDGVTSEDMCQSAVFMKYDMSSLKTLIFTNAPIQPIHQNTFQRMLPKTAIVSLYGTTETGIIAYQKDKGKLGASGRVNKNVRVMVVDLDTGEKLGPNMHGEICCKTGSMMKRYYVESKDTNSKVALTNDGWFYTGDYGYYDKDGEIFVIDQKKSLIKYNNCYIVPADIERVLLTHPAVIDTVVIPLQHTTDEQYPLAIVSTIKEQQVTKKELIDLVAEKLDDNMHLRGGVWLMTNLLPRFFNGKKNRKFFREAVNECAKVKSVDEHAEVTKSIQSIKINE